MNYLGIFMAIAIVAASAYYYYKNSNTSAKTINNVENKEDAASKEQELIANKKSNTKTDVKKKSKSAPKQKQKKIRGHHPRFIRRFGGHSEPILDMSISPNGEWLASAGLDGQLRVKNLVQKELSMSTNIKYSNTDDNLILKGNLGKIAWSPDNLTIVGTLVHSGELAFFRMRKKKDAATSKFPFELIELSKRRFATDSKVQGDINACVVDYTHSNFLLVLTLSNDPAHGNVSVAWDGTIGQAVGSAILGTNSGTASSTSTCPIRLSPDGKFLCRGGGSSDQVKVYEVEKKKIKGEINPVFDRISPKGVMTLTAGQKVADVCYFTDDNTSVAVVCCINGLIQVWDLNVEYRLREDPKRVCEYQLPADESEITHVAGSTTTGATNRIAVVTANGSLHLLTYANACLVLDFTIDETHEQRVADVKFCPSGDVVYTRGERSKDVFSWKVS